MSAIQLRKPVLTDVIRWVLTAVLLVFVWRGHMWAIKLLLTSGVLVNEVVAMVKR